MFIRKDVPVEERRIAYANDFYAIHLRPDFEGLFMNKARYDTEKPVRKIGEEYFVSLEDVRKIYSPDFRYELKNGEIYVQFEAYFRGMEGEQISRQWFLPVVPTHEAILKLGESKAVYDGEEKDLGAAPFEEDGSIYVPFTAMMGAFGARVMNHYSSRGGHHCCVTFNQDDPWLDKQITRTYATLVRGKGIGLLSHAFWFEEGNRMITTTAYVPFSYDPEKPIKAMFYFHGGDGNENSMFEETNNEICQIAEDRGYLLFGCNAFMRSAFNGSLVPPLFTIYEIDPAKVNDYNNPEGWSDYTLYLRKLSHDCVMANFEQAFRLFNIDRRNMFAMGNSAGSVACMHWALNYPDFFNRVVPTGGFVNYHFYDFEKLKRINKDYAFMCVVGTEDEGGIEGHLDVYKYMDELGVKYRRYIVGGGNHAYGWTHALPQVFDYFDEFLVK